MNSITKKLGNIILVKLNINLSFRINGIFLKNYKHLLINKNYL